MKPVQMARRIAYYAGVRFGQRPVHLNIEVTKHCNATCDFCDYWKTEEEMRIEDYSEVVRRFRPMVVVFTGGEPLLRKDISAVVRRVKETEPNIYSSLITNGSLLTIEKAQDLREAGLDRLCISLDYLGERHDRSRGCEGLFERIRDLSTQLPAVGFDKVAFNTIIMEDNLDDLVPIACFAKERSIHVGFSTYSTAKTGEARHFVTEASREKLRSVIADLLEAKRTLRNIVNSDYYLQRVPDYFFGGGIGGCKAGSHWLQITPAGMVKPCSELPILRHFRDFWPNGDVTGGCKACWFACRGEEEAPLDLGRVLELAGLPNPLPPPPTAEG